MSDARYLLQSYWSGPPLSLLELTCLTSWVTFGAHVHLYTHDSIEELEAQIPTHIRTHISVLNADAIVDRTKKFTYTGTAPKSKRTDAFTFLPFSDLFRYEMLRKVGGIWVDMDIILIRPFPALSEPYLFVSERTIQAGAYKAKEPSTPTNACIGVRDATSPWASWITNASATKQTTSAWTYLKLFKDSIKALDLHKHVQPPEFIMPLNWWDVDGIFKPGGGPLKSKYGVPATCPDSVFDNPHVIGVHLFRGILRKRNLPYEDRSKIPPTSFLGRLLQHVETASLN